MKKRIIKTDNIINMKPNTQMLHPISAVWMKNDETKPLCLTKFKITDDDNVADYTYKEYKCSSNLNNYNKYMYVPPVGITSAELLKIYDITENSIDSLNNWITNNNNNYYTVNRILNSWIKNNFDTLKIFY